MQDIKDCGRLPVLNVLHWLFHCNTWICAVMIRFGNVPASRGFLPSGAKAPSSSYMDCFQPPPLRRSLYDSTNTSICQPYHNRLVFTSIVASKITNQVITIHLKIWWSGKMVGCRRCGEWAPKHPNLFLDYQPSFRAVHHIASQKRPKDGLQSLARKLGCVATLD